MLPASWTFKTIEKRIRSLNAENFEVFRSKGFKVAGCQTLKMIDCASGIEPGPNAIAHNLGGMAEAADFFLRTPTLTASNFEAL